VNATDVTFDFASFKAAFERRDLARWTAFYADDAEWIEYQPSLSSREPRRMRGKRQIGDFLRWVCRADIDVHLSDEVLGEERAAFSVRSVFPDGREVFEHVIIYTSSGLVTRQVDVEAWDRAM